MNLRGRRKRSSDGGATDWLRESPDTGDWTKGPFGWADLELGRGAPDDSSYTWLGLV